MRKFFGNAIVVTLLFVSVISAGHYLGWLKKPEDAVIRSIGTLARPFSAIGRYATDAISFVGSIKNLTKENKRMSDEISRLTAQNAFLQEVRRENDTLREQLKITESTDFELATALVIGRDPSNIASEIMINKGSADGLLVGRPVIISDGVVIGRTSDVHEHTSRVLLITDGRSRINVTDQVTRASGILRGQHGLGLVIDTVPQNEVLQQDDTLITSGLGGVFPRGLVVGKIADIRNSDNELFQEATVQQLFRLRELESVFVIIK